MDTINQQNIRMKITTFTENLNILLDATITGSTIYIMTEKINFLKLTQMQYHNLIFEQELFNILLKNRYAINNTEDDAEDVSDDVDNGNNRIKYAAVTPIVDNFINTEYPFTLIICSKDGHRSSILVNNVGIVIVKFIIYLRMLNQLVGRSDCPNCLLAINLRKIPFGRICIDVDYKAPMFGDICGNNATTPMTNDEYEKFKENCFKIVADMTTVGNIIMTENCFTPNTRSFHLITEQQFDSATRDFMFFKMSEKIRNLNPYVKIDKVQVWMLPMGRGHVPVRKYNRKTNEYVNELAFPFTETDFELTMPFDLNQSTDNLYTLLNFVIADDSYDNNEHCDILNEYSNDDILHSYRININIDKIEENLQLYVKVLSFKYDFAFQSRNKYRFKYNYIHQVLGNKYNNYFSCMTNKKLLFESNWQIPKPKIKQRPTEFYEIYRFITHKYINNIDNMLQLFDTFPRNLVSKNVNIGNSEEIITNSTGNRQMSVNGIMHTFGNYSHEINEVYSGKMKFKFTFHDTTNTENNNSDHIHEANNRHPWSYMYENYNELTPIASVSTKNIYEYFRKTIVNNTYDYEKDPLSMKYFTNIQSTLSHDTLEFSQVTNDICRVIINSDISKIQKYMFPMYEFFCRIHYIDSCVTTDEYTSLHANLLNNTPRATTNEMLLNQYRKKYIELSPCNKAYRKFPIPNTRLHDIWNNLSPENKIITHIIYLLIVEHNYTSIFVYLHNLFKTNDTTHLVCSFLLNILDDTYTDSNTNKIIRSYASKEFLNFVYKTFINGGMNMHCGHDNDGNVRFNMVNLTSIMSDFQSMFIGSPIWFFLGNFQYMDENIEFTKRFDLFLQMFQQEAHDENFRENGLHDVDGGGGNGNMNYGDLSSSNAKQSKISKTSSFTPDKYFKAYNINAIYHGDLLNIFYRNIISLCKTENGVYIYDESRFCMPTLSIKYTPQIINDPVKYSTIYRHQYGIYNTWTMQFERNISILYTQINISNDEFAKYPELFNAYNDDIYKIMINRFLKSITFTRVLNCQRNLGLLLAPIYDPTTKLQTNSPNMETLNYNIDSIQINIHDLPSTDYVIPDEMLFDILQTKNKFYEMFKWLYAIICHYSENFSCIITTPSSFIPKCIIPETLVSGTSGTLNNVIDTNGIDKYSMFHKQLAANRYDGDNEANNGENSLHNLLHRIHTILSLKSPEQQKNIIAELQKLSQQEITSLIILFDNVSKSNGNGDSSGGNGDDDDGDEIVDNIENDETNHNSSNNDFNTIKKITNNQTQNEDERNHNRQTYLISHLSSSTSSIESHTTDVTLPKNILLNECEINSNNSSNSSNDNRAMKNGSDNRHNNATTTSDSINSEFLTKFNLSATGGCNGNSFGGINSSENFMFSGNLEYMDNSKNKLLSNLFNRKLSKEITQMSVKNFQKIIDENFSTHIAKFILYILSWFIRTTHSHRFSDTHFFREIQHNRQLLYNELSELTFKHNGYFIYNNSIVDIADIFSHYCRNVNLVVDPIFEMSFNVDPQQIYLGYDKKIESRVSAEIIADIESGCVSSIYQGQFIENTNADLNRLWARVTVPRNKHRISPLFNLHTATGKSEYLTERCRKHFNNKYYNNFMDSTSLKSSERGISIARELHSNLIVCIEEFNNLNETFKQICGHSSVTYKPLWNDLKSSFQNNSTVILSTNNDPKCTEDAVIARLHIFPRRIQYTNVNRYLKFQRTTIVSTATLQNTNNIFAAQLIMEKMPRVVAENYKGNFMMTWILKRFFLYNINDPVTIQTSETLQSHIDGFRSMFNAQQLVLERLELNTGEMKLFEFRKLTNRICDENRHLFNSKIDTCNVYTILCDKLKAMINNETQTIRVSECDAK